MYKALLILSTYWLCALAIDPRITLNLDLPSLSKRVPSANEIRCYPDKYDKTGLGDLDKGQFSRSWDKAYLSPTDRLQYQKIWEQVIQPDYGHLYSGDPVVLDSFRKEFSFYFTLDNQQRNDAFYGAQSTIALALAADYNFQAERVFQYFTHETNEAYTQALHNNDPKDKRTASQFVEEYYRKRIYVLVTDKGMKLIAKNSNWPNPQSSSEQIALAQKARAYTASHGESSSSGANADVVPQIEEDQQFKLFEIIKNDIGRVLNTCVKERKHRGYYIHYEGSTLVYAVSMGLPSLNLRYIFDVGWPDTFARIPEKRWSSPIEPPSAEQTSHPIVPESFPMGLRIPDTQTMNRGDTDIEAGNAQRQPPLDATSRCLQIVSHLCALPCWCCFKPCEDEDGWPKEEWPDLCNCKGKDQWDWDSCHEKNCPYTETECLCNGQACPQTTGQIRCCDSCTGPCHDCAKDCYTNITGEKCRAIVGVSEGFALAGIAGVGTTALNNYIREHAHWS